MKKYLLFIMSGMLMTSCLDTIVLPKDITIGEDYWQNREQAQAMVNGAYKQMVTDAVVKRMIVWGDYRSDEMNYETVQDFSGNSVWADLQKISLGNIDSDNQFSTWSDVYSVINKCNIVLEKAPGVVSIDPAYTMETFNTDKSQMLALRSLCYFYLVRAFRDVPFTTVAYLNSSQDKNIAQSAPAVVLDRCIADLEEALKSPISSSGYNDWRRVGIITEDGIKAILADIHLWRASVLHSADDYQKCIQYCDEIIASKKASALSGGNGENGISATSEYPLIETNLTNYLLFVSGNSAESIFELQMDGNNDVASAIKDMFFVLDKKNFGAVMATKIFGTIGSETGDNATVYTTNMDNRYLENVYGVGDADASSFDIRKMVDADPLKRAPSDASRNPYKLSAHNATAVSRTSLDRYAQNWIVYRLTDIMLMKAEALVQLAADGALTVDDENLTEAFNIVDAVNRRSLAKQDDANVLKITSYTYKEDMEQLVLCERQRELCFEGKRWFDLMRYNYRHITPSDYTKTLFEISGEKYNEDLFPANYSGFSSLVRRKYLENGVAIMAKMGKEPFLYFPVPNSDMKVNPLLHQNPAYSEGDKYVKN